MSWGGGSVRDPRILPKFGEGDVMVLPQKVSSPSAASAALSPTPKSVLEVLKADRIIAVGRDLEISVDVTAKKGKDVLIGKLTAPGLDLARLLRVLGRDELREACRAHGLDDDSRSRTELSERLLAAASLGGALAPEPALDPTRPAKGDVVQVRQRQYLVEKVEPGEHGLVHLVCLDDDAQGRALQVIWALELGARVLRPESTALGAISTVDEPRTFAAYYHALKWSCVSATDARLFQSPFRAGIKLMNHQLTALKKALELPRVNLFIADDVGLGKTIEAGLVLQELILRQRVDFVVIVCPASVLLQWRDEMDKRFGLGFEVYNRSFVQRRRQERGFGVNPWATHNRFIISYQTLRRPEYRDPLLATLDDRGRKSLLILDEAHTAAPSSSSIYGIDSKITEVIRDVAPLFENRLFLSATPHNGHSNSFSSLLEILDEKRFTRGVDVNQAELEPVMVRRLKEDLRQLNVDAFPRRRVGAVELTHEAGRWTERVRWAGDAVVDGPWTSAPADDAELRLARMLSEYTSLMKPERGPGRLVFINLQKRLLSSVEAFFRTLRKHAGGIGKAGAGAMFRKLDNEDSELPLGIDDDVTDEEDGEEAAAQSAGLQSPAGRARQLLDEMLVLAEQRRSAPDAKTRALVGWLQRKICDGFTLDDGAKVPKKVAWQPRRVIIFTEYGDTKKHLYELLVGMCERLPQGEGRVMQMHGGMSDEQRDEVQKAFLGPPDQYPVRILVATDAAREGINLQAHCADLFHFDVPWNPGRMEQRNGRIDRTLQPAEEVRCHYFSYTQREEDRVIDVLVDKVERIQRELGSIGQVIMERIEESLQDGLTPSLLQRLDGVEQEGQHRRAVATTELEGQRDLKRLKLEIDQAAKILSDSRRVMNFDPSLLRDAVDVGLELSGFARIAGGADIDDSMGTKPGHLQTWTVPAMSSAWDRTLDKLRPARERDENFWEWRKHDPMPVVFEPPQRLRDDVVHLHLAHPFVQRVLSRFLAQGFSAQDLSRVTVVRNRHDDVARVLMLGRLTLFGPGAVRLHDELLGVAAEWNETHTGNHLKPFSVEDDKRALTMLEQIFTETQGAHAIPEGIRHRFVNSAAGDMATLWKHVEAEADARAQEAAQKLAARGVKEAEALTRILKNQKSVIHSKLGGQLGFSFDQSVQSTAEERRQAQQQWATERNWMEDRLVKIDVELRDEPDELAKSYATSLRRVVPVGLVYLWPETR